MDTTHVHEVSLRFVIYYSRSKWKRNNLSIVVSFINFKMTRLKLMSKIIIYLKKKEKGLEILDWISMRSRQEQFELEDEFFST
jgi:hypothetical protein